jgi:hypothetical protein
MKAILSLCLMLALTGFANAQSSPPAPEKKPVPDINKSPWSAQTTTSSDGYFGSTTTTIKRDVGDGWALGAQMSTPFEDRKIGGSGPPGLDRYESPNGKTLFGPYLEKKF